MLTSPKLIDPLQMALGIRASIPNLSADEQGDSGETARAARFSSVRWRWRWPLARPAPAMTATAASTTTAPPGAAVGLDEIQVLAAHNAYHLEGEEALLDAITQALPELTPTIEYSHPTLTEQLDLGLRSLELDLFEDPDGGRYAAPKAQALLGLDPIDPVMAGARLQGVPHPGGRLPLDLPHLRGLPRGAGGVVRRPPRPPADRRPPRGQGRRDPRPARPRLRAADPGDRGHLHRARGGDPLACSTTTSSSRSPTCRATTTPCARRSRTRAGPTSTTSAIASCSCSTTTSPKRDLYRALHPDTRDRLIFVDAQPPDDDAAFTVLNDPVADGDRIRELVELGYLVRTRTDADTVEARTGDTTRREAAFASGAQIVSTDYELEDPRFPGFVVELPGDGPARCNPVSAPADCADATLPDG